MEPDDGAGGALIPIKPLAQATLAVLALDVMLSCAVMLLVDLSTGEVLLESMGMQLRGVLIIMVLLWLFRAYRNLGALDVPTQGGRWSVVGWWFVPIANMFVPYQRCSEILWGSCVVDADALDEAETPMRSWESTALVGWWVAWIGSGILGRVVGRLDLDGTTLMVLLLVVLALELLSALLLALFVWRASVRQHAHAETVGLQELSDPVWGKLALAWWFGGGLLGWATFALGAPDTSKLLLVGVMVAHTIIGFALAAASFFKSRAPRGAFTVVAVTIYVVWLAMGLFVAFSSGIVLLLS